MKYLLILLSFFPVLSLSQTLDGGRWNYYSPDCLPGIDAVDYRMEIDESIGVIIWWCDINGKFSENFRASNNGAKLLEDFNRDNRNSDIIFLNSKEFNMKPSEELMKRIDNLRNQFKPQCRVTGDGAVYTTTGDTVIKSDYKLSTNQILSCGYKVLINDTEYCFASGVYIPHSVMVLPYNSWTRCEIKLAPAKGW